MNKKKCEFSKAEVAYLGHVIPKARVSMDNPKEQAKLEWPISRTKKNCAASWGLRVTIENSYTGTQRLLLH